MTNRLSNIINAVTKTLTSPRYADAITAMDALRSVKIDVKIKAGTGTIRCIVIVLESEEVE